MREQKRLGVRLSEGDVLRGNDRPKTVFQSILFEDVADFLLSRAGGDRQRQPFGRGFYGGSCVREKYVSVFDGLEIINALTADEIMKPGVRQRRRMLVEK